MPSSGMSVRIDVAPASLLLPEFFARRTRRSVDCRGRTAVAPVAAWAQPAHPRWTCLDDGRSYPYGAGGQSRIEVTDGAGVADGGEAEIESGAERIGGPANVVPVEDELTQVLFPMRLGRRQGGRRQTLRGGHGKGVEGGVRIAGIARPPADLDLLRITGIAGDE